MNIAPVLKSLRRRFRTPVIRAIYHLFARLSIKSAQRVGAIVGWFFWAKKGKLRSISEQNIAACFPLLDQNRQQAIVKNSLLEMGKTMFEVPAIWHSDARQFDQLIRQVHGRQYADAAFQKGRGVVVMTPHLGAWEVAGLYFSKHYPMVTMYRPSQIDGVDDLIQAGRTRFGTRLVATDIKGVKRLYQALRNGEVLGILPDQDPGKNGGDFAPFFGIRTNTMTLVNRIIHKSGAAAIFCYARRLPSGAGYDLYIYPAPDELGSSNVEEAITHMNLALEKIIAECPEQYQWSYRRFKTRPQGEAKFYQ